MTTFSPATPAHVRTSASTRSSRRRAWRTPLRLAAGAAVLHLAFVWLQSAEYVLRVDDAFYYFQIARNAAQGSGFTFDGIHPTNGFQPLWGLVLAGFAWLFLHAGAAEPMLLARLFLSVAALVNVAAGLALYAAARGWLRRRDALGFLAVWLLSPLLVSHQTAGMENALFALLLGLALAVYNRHFRDADRPPGAGSAAVLGLLLGLVALARLEAALLAAIVVPTVAWRMRRMPVRAAAVRLAPLCLLAALPVAAYLALNLARLGHAMPIPGEVKRFYALQALDAVGGPGSAGHARLLAENLAITVLRLLYVAAGPVLLAWGWLYPLYGAALARMGTPLMVAAPAVNGAAVALLAVWTAFGRGRARALRRRLRPLLRPGVLHAFALAQICAFAALYPIYLRGPGVGWYFVPAYVLQAMAAGVAGTFAVERLRARLPRVRRWIAPAAVGAMAVNFVLYLGWEARPGAVRTPKLEVVAWMHDNLPADAVVGSYNAGAIGFFARQRVVNLDGLVNDFDYLDHLRAGRVEAYARREGIGYLVEYATSGQTPAGRWRDLPVGRVLLARPFPTVRTTYFVVELPWAARE